ncbi:unnamed protein product [Arabidopsis arenosa]|uniref:Uncharacterized protein n=1 Tax=Arabidopsis arenosa TaxID=38785 RepID=A0A8S1ZXJ2_ARAAE|nr:unnamed protein product [Arabidopsis arenosa]
MVKPESEETVQPEGHGGHGGGHGHGGHHGGGGHGLDGYGGGHYGGGGHGHYGGGGGHGHYGGGGGHGHYGGGGGHGHYGGGGHHGGGGHGLNDEPVQTQPGCNSFLIPSSSRSLRASRLSLDFPQCNNVDTILAITGLKSHDYHVLMQQLLPIALRGLLPKGPRVAIVRLCSFFNHLCQRVIDREQILTLDAEVVETLCMFERFVPPSFFDIMVNLTVHLGREARLEGCIGECYLAEECIQFCNEFWEKTTNVQEKADRNTEYENNSILEGRPISTGKSISLSEMEKKIAHMAVIQNMAVVDPYAESSAKDTSQVVDLVSYYGRVTDIILLDYNVFYVPLFLCQWAVKGNGVKEEDGFTLVNLNHSQVSFSRDPYILASQAKQVFYSREDESSSWYVAMRGPSRRFSQKDFQAGNADISPLPANIDMGVDLDEAENERTDFFKIRKAKTNQQRMNLRPKNVSPFEWRKFMKLKTSKEFKRKAAEIVNSDAPSSAIFEAQDSLSQLLRPDNPGRLRVMCRNMTKTKLACFQVKNKCMDEMQEKQANLQHKVNELQDVIEKMKSQRQDSEVGETQLQLESQPKCILTDWTSGDANVAEERIITSDPNDLVNDSRLGPTDVKVLVEIAIVPEAFLWRPAINMFTIEKVVGQMIAWPASKCVNLEQELQSEDIAPLGQRSNSSNKCKLLDLTSDAVIVAEGRWQTQEQNALVNGLTLGPNAVKVFVDVRINGAEVIKEKQKCKLMDIGGRKQVVAEGRVHSVDLDTKVHYVCLGSNTARVWVDIVKIDDEAVWRPSDEIEYMRDALGSSIAWPMDKLVIF